MAKILHVSDNFGGGLVTALHGYVENSRQHQHYLLAAKRAGYHDAMEWAKHFSGQYQLPSSFREAPAVIRALDAEIKPDWIHLHSSFAGAYGRLAFLPRRKIIYTPHCYAFERKDINPVIRAGYWLVEQLLAAGNAKVAAISPREDQLARAMLLPQQTVMLPNVPIIPEAAFTTRQAYQRGERLRVAMVGRLTPQKDPDYFIATVKLVKLRNLPIDFIWLGGGDDVWAKQLTDLGVTVTGWISHGEILERLAQCDVYFHTAAWESGPLSVLEAAQLGLMMVCRAIPAIDVLPVRPNVGSVLQAADVICGIAQGVIPEGLSAINGVLNQKYSLSTQQAALAELYRLD
jgi:glycosyltransferase involved in cell wall biosynthesis